MIHPSSRLNRMNGFVIIELSIKSLQAFMFEFDKMLLLFKKRIKFERFCIFSLIKSMSCDG